MQLIRTPKPVRQAQRGLSVVELMVGVAIGLFIVAAAAMVVSSQLSSNRRLLLDTQLQQDLRITADIVTRELRRAGAMRDAMALRTVWHPTMTLVPMANSFAADLEAASAPTSVRYRYQRAPTDSTRYGFRLNGTRLQSLADDTAQDLTDPSVMSVTAFTITPSAHTPVKLPCPRNCPDGTQDCWPTVAVREFTVEITAQAANDPSIQRSVRSQVRVANDYVARNTPITDPVCPA